MNTSISCYLLPPWRMLSCFASTSTEQQCWWQQPLPHSRFLSAGCEEKEKTYLSSSSFFFFLSPHNKSHLLTAAGARESLSLGVSEHGCTSKFPAYFLLPASRWRCSAYKQLHSFHHFVVTWSGALPNKGRSPAITAFCHSSSFLRQCNWMGL